MATVAQSPNDLTRQQLDELDALLQRMLSLPLNPPESFPPNEAPAAQAYSPPMPTPLPMPAQTPAPAVREAPVVAPPPAPRAYTPPTTEPAQLPTPWKTVAAPESTPAPAPVPVPRPAPLAPVFERPAPEPVSTLPFATPLPPAPPPEPVPVLLAPLVAFNAALNWTLGLFGLPGRILRSGFVKFLFGLAGLGLLAYTGLKVAQIHSLVSLPVQLPWPR